MLLSFKNEHELREVGLVLDPCDAGTALPIGQLYDRQQGKTAAEGVRDSEIAEARLLWWKERGQ